AYAASAPCPSPSMPATKVSSPPTSTTARSPLVCSPGRQRVATLHSTVSPLPLPATMLPLLSRTRELIAESPLRHRHGRARRGVGCEFELVHQSARTRKAKAQAVAAAVVVSQGCVRVAQP